MQGLTHSEDLQLGVWVHGVLGLVAVEHSLQRADVQLLVLLHVFRRWVGDRRELQRTAVDRDEVQVVARHERQEPVAQEESARDPPLVELEAELLQVRERVVRLLLAKCECRIDLRPCEQSE